MNQPLFNETNHPSEATSWYRHPDVPSTVPAANHRDSESATAFGAVIAFTFILLLAPQLWFPALAPFRIALLAAGTAIVSLLWNRWRHRGSLLRLTPELAVGLALPAWALLTMPLSYWPGGSMSVLTEPYIKALTIFWLLANVVTNERRLRSLATVLILCTVPLTTTAVKNFASGTYYVSHGQAAMDRIHGYEAGLAENPNDLALMLNLLLPLGIALFLGAEKTSVRVLCGLAIGLNVVGVILTFSRAGFVGLATLGIVYFVKLVRRPGADRSWAFAVLALAMLSLPLLPSGYTRRLATVTDIEADPTGSAQARWRDTVAAVQFVMDNPVTGAGIGMDILALNHVRGPHWKHIHNIYLQYAVDLGLPGLALFLGLFYGVFRAVRRSRRAAASMPGTRNLFLLAEALEVSLIVFAVSGLFYPVAYHFYFYYIAGLALATRAAFEATVSVPSPSTPGTASPPAHTLVSVGAGLSPRSFPNSRWW